MSWKGKYPGGMEREKHVMNYDLDDIQCIQAQLTELSCEDCCRQRLVLLLRYDGRRRRCLLMAFCQSCRMKQPIPSDIARRLNNQKPHADAQELTDQDFVGMKNIVQPSTDQLRAWHEHKNIGP
jgi:hypothetical protein